MLYPRSTMTRSVQSLDGTWRFKPLKYLEEFDPLKPLEDFFYIAVPASFNDQLVDNDLRFFAGHYVYERTLDLPAVKEGQRLVLRFGAIAHEALIFINGEEICHNLGGFLPFEVEIQEQLKVGRNRFTILANNLLNFSTLPVGNLEEISDEDGHVTYRLDENFDFFNYAGIIRPVKLYTTSTTYLDDMTITAHVDGITAFLSMDFQTVGTYDRIKVEVYNAANDRIAGIERKGENDQDQVRLEIPVTYVRLWEPMDPYLYEIKVSLFKDNQLLDEYFEPYGIRTVEVKDHKFLINGKPFYFKGFGKHEDSYINGRGFNQAVNICDLHLMKKMGANSFRTSHYPYAEEMMYLADRLGFVVIDEVPAVGLFTNFSTDLQSDGPNTWDQMQTMPAHKDDIKRLIARDKNHASVVMWSIANEAATHQDGAREYFEPLFDLARACDAQKRPVTIVSIGLASAAKDQAMGMADVICLNRYFGWYNYPGDLKKAEQAMEGELEEWVKRFPGKPVIYTEYGADAVPGLHSIYQIPFTEEYQIHMIKMMSKVMDSKDYVVGEQVWNFSDFETKVGVTRVQGNKKGAFSRNREPKMLAFWLEERWKSIPHFGYKA